MRETYNGEQNLSNSNNGFRNGLSYLLIGGGIGAVLALLFAPKSGSDLRGDIADVSRRGYDATLEKATALKDQSAEVIQNVREKADKVYDFAASKLAKGEDLVNDAVVTASDAVSNGLDKLKDDASQIANKTGNGRRASSIM